MSGLPRMSPVTSPVQRLLIGLVRGYRYLLSPWLGSACRFEPTCSAYALEALTRHGASTGARLTVGRLLRCHPWCAGGCDPVPDRPRPLFSSLPGLSRLNPDPGAAVVAADGSSPVRKNSP
ncbi:MAG: hypothetical protein RLZZ524_3016 [Pseudomonadota bacterium]